MTTGDRMDTAKLDEHLHKIEKECEGKVKIKKSTTTSPDKFTADGTLHDVKQINKSLKESNYTVTQVEENKIIVKGQEKYVYEVKQKIEGMLHCKLETDQALSGNIIEYDNFLLYIEENGVLENLLKKHEIQYSNFHKNNKKGLYYRGEETNCSQFRQELERLKGSYITHNIAVNLGDRMDTAKLDEHLHKIEKECEGKVKIKKSTTTSPDKFTAETVIGVTLEDDLRDCLYTQWHEDGYTVTVVEGISELPSADLVLVPVGGKSNPDFSQGIAKNVALPIPEKSGKNPIDAILTSVHTILTDETVVSVCITLPVINGWKNYVYIKPILYALKTYMSKSKGPRKDIIFCCCDRGAYDYCFEFCKNALQTKYETVMPINKDRYMDKFCIEVKKGGIVDFEVDVIVNTTGTNLDLSFGAVSSTILKCAGQALQQEVKRKKPKGIQNGEILETSSFDLDKVEIILHGALASYSNRKDLQKLEDFVIRCFRHADSKHFKSIALPAIGTGNLGYKKQDVAATMFKAAKKFFRDNHPSYLRQVLFVIYPKDGECLKAFEAEEKLWYEYLRYQERAVVYNRVRVQPRQGSISETLSDAVIYLWDEGKVDGSFHTADTSLMKACGKNVYEKVSRMMRGKKEELVKEKAENINADVYFKKCQNSFEKIHSAISHCLQEADKCKDISSICIAFDKSHSFLLNDDLTYALCEAIKDVSHEIKHIKQVEIMMEGEKSFSAVFEHFGKEKNGLLQSKEPVNLEISGFEEHVVKAVDEVSKGFSNFPEQDENMLSREEQISRLQSTIRDLEEDCGKKESSLQKLERDLMSVEDSKHKTDDSLSRREITIQQLEHELVQVKTQYRESVEENGRLEARIHVFAINAQSEQDVLNSEVKRREDAIKRLKMDYVNLQEINNKREEKINQLEREVEQHKTQLRTANTEIEAKKSNISTLETQVDDLKKRSSNQLDEINRLEDQVRNMNIDQTAMQSKIDNLQLNSQKSSSAAKAYVLKKVGKVWLLGKSDDDLKKCPQITGAEEVDLHGNLLVEDETVYEIKESDNEQLFIVKMEEIPLFKQYPDEPQQHLRSDHSLRHETDSVGGKTQSKSHNEEPHNQTMYHDMEVPGKTTKEYRYSLLEAGQTEATSSICVSFATGKIEQGKGEKYIEPTDTEKYVEVHNIPDGIDDEALAKDLFRIGKFPIAIPILIYFKGSDKALLICQSKEDAIKLSKCKTLHPFRFSCLKGEEIRKLTWTVSLDIMEKIQQKGKYEELKEKLSEADIQVKVESPLVLVAPTTFQLKYVNFLIDEFTDKIEKEARDTAEDSFSTIERVQDIPENVWEVLYCSEQYKELTKKNSKISYKNGAIIFEPGMEECKDELQKITELVKELRKREWEEIHLEKKDQEKTTVDKWCEEMDEAMGYECCKYIVDKGNVLVYAKKYEDVQTVKYVFGVKTGKVKPIARGRRGQASSDKDETNTDYGKKQAFQYK